MLQIYNTLTRSIEPFKPLSQNEVKVYYCGPTVYNYAHIGNLRTFLFEDFLVRTLRFLGYKARTTMNLTDIDDKTIRDSMKAGEPLQAFTQRYTDAFLEDLRALQVIPADTVVPISELIDDMVRIIQGLLDSKHAYLAEDGSVYFSIATHKTYGQLAHLDMQGMKAGARVNNDEYAKDSAADFVLWKAYNEASDGPNRWDASFVIWGETVTLPGRPGWHIECSACNMRYFGPQIDIHMGGVDLVFPHHQNEIAQTEAFTGKTFAKYWMHAGHLLVDGKKMAKSAGNFYTLRDIYQHFPQHTHQQVARAFRLLCLTSQYRENTNFTFASLTAAINTLNGLDAVLDRLAHLPRIEWKFRADVREFVQIAMIDFVEYLEDDINTPEALARVHDFIGDLNKVLDETELYQGEIQSIIELLKSFDAVLGIFDFSRLEQQEIPEEVRELLQEREKAKQQKHYELADSKRSEIESKGYKVVDTKDGAKLIRSTPLSSWQ